MKKILLSAFLACGILGAKAQLNDGMKAIDFTFTALNNGGQVVNLYSWLDSGKYVFLDVSATWCGPCWNFHNTNALKDLYTQHGPGGTLSDDVRVVFVEGDGTTADALMSGGSGSQGNWLAGTNYPMCNPAQAAANQFNDDYEIGYYPTVYMICPDRTVKEVGTLSAAQLYALVSPNPQCAPKINVDVTPWTYDGKLMTCDGNFNLTMTIKNRGFNNLTSATINVKNGATTVASQPWTGNLATYATSSNIVLPLSAVNPSYDSLSIEVIATGDQIAANDKFTVRIDNYAQSSAAALPLNQNFDALTAYPTRFGFDNVTSQSKFGFYDGINGTTKLVGASGSNTKAMFVGFYNTAANGTGITAIGNFNTNTTATHLNLDFDLAHCLYDGSENDKLEVVVSTDCGATWTSKWSKSGTALATRAPLGNASFIPKLSSEWRSESVNLNSIKNNPNAIVGFRMTSGYGNYAWIDNIKLAGNSSPASTNNFSENSFDIYPNPTTQFVNIRGLAGDASIKITDIMGRVVKTNNYNNISNEITLDVAELVNGQYFVHVSQNENSVVKAIVIAK